MKNKDYKDLTDDQLVDLIKDKKDEYAFLILTERYKNKIAGLCYDFVGDVHLAEELTQDILIKVFYKCKYFKKESKFSTWLYRVSINHCKDVVKSKFFLFFFKKEIEIDYNLVAKTKTPLDDLILDEKQQKLRKAINKLPEKQKIAIVLKYYHNKKIEEIAEILKKSSGTIKATLFKAMANLKKIIEEENEM